MVCGVMFRSCRNVTPPVLPNFYKISWRHKWLQPSVKLGYFLKIMVMFFCYSWSFFNRMSMDYPKKEIAKI